MGLPDLSPELAGYFQFEAKQAKYFRLAGIVLGILATSLFLISPPESAIALRETIVAPAPPDGGHQELSQHLMRLCVDVGMYALLPMAFFVFSTPGINRLRRIDKVLKSSPPIGVEAVFRYVERDDGFEPMVEVVSVDAPLSLQLPATFRVTDPGFPDRETHPLVGHRLPGQGYFDPQRAVFAAIRIGDILLLGEYGDG